MCHKHVLVRKHKYGSVLEVTRPSRGSNCQKTKKKRSSTVDETGCRRHNGSKDRNASPQRDALLTRNTTNSFWVPLACTANCRNAMWNGLEEFAHETLSESCQNSEVSWPDHALVLRRELSATHLRNATEPFVLVKDWIWHQDGNCLWVRLDGRNRCTSGITA